MHNRIYTLIRDEGVTLSNMQQKALSYRISFSVVELISILPHRPHPDCSDKCFFIDLSLRAVRHNENELQHCRVLCDYLFIVIWVSLGVYLCARCGGQQSMPNVDPQVDEFLKPPATSGAAF